MVSTAHYLRADNNCSRHRNKGTITTTQHKRHYETNNKNSNCNRNSFFHRSYSFRHRRIHHPSSWRNPRLRPISHCAIPTPHSFNLWSGGYVRKQQIQKHHQSRPQMTTAHHLSSQTITQHLHYVTA